MGATEQLSRPQTGVRRLVGATVVVASSRTVRRRRLAAALREHGLEVVALKSNAERALGAVMRRRPRLCVLDADLDGNLMTATRELCREHPEIVLAVVVDTATERRGARALRAGADLVIPDGGDRLVDALATYVAKREALEDPELADATRPGALPEPIRALEAAPEPRSVGEPEAVSRPAPPPLRFADPPARRPAVRGLPAPRRRIRRLEAPRG